MKLFISCCLALVLILGGSPSQAQEELELYDSFKGKSIDPDKWVPDGSWKTPIYSFDLVREVSGNSLRMLNRIYAGDFRIGTSVRVRFPDPRAVTAIMIKGKVKDVELIGCGESYDYSRIRALRVSGFFFNTIADGGLPVSGALGDVLASIHVERRADSEDPPGVFRVVAYLFVCGDPDCNNGSFLPDLPIDLGEYKVGADIKLFMQWVDMYNYFIFQRDNEPEETYAYDPVLNQGEPGLPRKILGISPRVEGCMVMPGDPQPVAFVETLIDEVFVNESAVP